ncbi:hypothetical protein M3231_00620 [Neobacillus mesonae]|nr:hypothetical protein [Neobacillus mesonae]
MSFYRFGVTGGFISIAGGLLGIFLLDALWGGRDAGNLILDMFSIQPFQFTALTALVASLALIIVIFMVHRLISKNVVVRTK